MSWIRKSYAGRFIAVFMAMQLLAAAFCLPPPSSIGLDDSIAVAVTDHAGEPCGTPENECDKALCHPALAAAMDTIAIEPNSQLPLTFQQSFAQFASGPDSRPPLSISA